MKPSTKMLWLFGLIILASALFFVLLGDDDTKTTGEAQASSVAV